MALVLAIPIASSIAGIGNQFVQDDGAILVESTRLHGFAELYDILTQPFWPPPHLAEHFRPVTSLVLALQWVIGLGSPLVFRFASYALYAASTFALFRFSRKILSPGAAFAVAALFGAHPLHVEAVALALGQAELLMATSAIIAIDLYLTWRRAQPQGLTWTQWALIAGLYAFSSLAKEQGLVLPALLASAELLLLPPGGWKDRARRLWAGYAAVTLVGIGALVARTAVLGGRIEGSIIPEPLQQNLPGRALTMLQVVPTWLRLLAWPAHLQADYLPGEIVASRGFGPKEILGLAIVSATVALIWWAWRRAPNVAFGLVWCAIGLLPVSNLIVVSPVLVAERTLFLSSAGFVIAVVGGFEVLVARRIRSTPPRLWLVTVGVLVVLGAVRSDTRQRIWYDRESFMFATVSDAPRSWVIQRAFGALMFDMDRSDDGVRAYRTSIANAPEPWPVRNELASRLMSLGRGPEAVDQLKASLAEKPGQVAATAALAPALLSTGQYVEARRLADSVIAVAQAPPFMLLIRHLADSAIANKLPAGSVRLGATYAGAPR